MLRIKNQVLLSAVDASINESTAAVDLENMLGYSIQAIFTGAPVGTLKLQGSDDWTPDAQFVQPPPTNWTDITGSSTAVSAAGSVLFNTANSYYRWVRAVYTATSGSGTLTIQVNAKGF